MKYKFINIDFINKRDYTIHEEIMNKLNSLSQECITILTPNQKKIFTVESCTAGLVASSIGEIPRASNILEGGIIAYSNNIKKLLLQVSDTILTQFGAVSFECAIQMALGARIYTTADYILSVSGIAGPNGDSSEKPIGTVYTAILDKNNKGWAQHFKFEGTRKEIQIQSVEVLLTLLLATEKEEEFFDLRLYNAQEIC